MEELFGLPAHALLIHAPIVLLPLVALVTVVLAARPAWRARVHWWMVGAILSVVVMMFLAKSSGEAFNDAFDGAVDVSRHESLANTAFVLTILWFVTYAALIGYEHAMRRNDPPASLSAGAAESGAAIPAVTYGLAAVTSILAVLATIWLIRAGHEGADVVWGQTQIFD